LFSHAGRLACASVLECTLSNQASVKLVDENQRVHWEERERELGFIRVRIRLLDAAEGGRQGPIASGYQASWDIGNRTESGERTLNDAPLLLENRVSLRP
jgi:hypothetical protein